MNIYCCHKIPKKSSKIYPKGAPYAVFNYTVDSYNPSNQIKIKLKLQKIMENLYFVLGICKIELRAFL